MKPKSSLHIFGRIPKINLLLLKYDQLAKKEGLDHFILFSYFSLFSIYHISNINNVGDLAGQGCMNILSVQPL